MGLAPVLGPPNLSVNFFFGGGGAIEEAGAGGLALKLVMLFGGAAVRLVRDGGGLPAKPAVAGAEGEPAPKAVNVEEDASPPKLRKPPRFMGGVGGGGVGANVLLAPLTGDWRL